MEKLTPLARAKYSRVLERMAAGAFLEDACNHVEAFGLDPDGVRGYAASNKRFGARFRMAQIVGARTRRADAVTTLHDYLATGTYTLADAAEASGLTIGEARGLVENDPSISALVRSIRAPYGGFPERTPLDFPEAVRAFLGYLRAGHSQTVAATMAGINRSTPYKWYNEQPMLYAAYYSAFYEGAQARNKARAEGYVPLDDDDAGEGGW